VLAAPFHLHHRLARDAALAKAALAIFIDELVRRPSWQRLVSGMS
jgi:hypothetical protein